MCDHFMTMSVGRYLIYNNIVRDVLISSNANTI